MTRRLAPVLALLAVSACQEANLFNPNIGRGRGDAPDLATPRRTDVIIQTTVPEVDVLWVVDNSCSMQDEQNKLAANFSSFIGFFLDSGLDWHIGVVSTDMSNDRQSGKLRTELGYTYLTSELNDPTGLFGGMVNLGTNGSASEQGIDAAFAAIEAPTQELAVHNDGFYREAASLHIVVISDEDDQSTRSDPFEFANYLQNIKQSAEIPVTFSSIVTMGQGCGGQGSQGASYLQVTNAVGGIAFNICESDWQPVLEQLGLQAAGLKDTYFLSEVPVAESLSVWMTDGETGDRWEGIDLATKPPKPTVGQVCKNRFDHLRCFGYAYDVRRNAVNFPEFVPNAFSEVFVDYEVLSQQQPIDLVEGDEATPPE